MVEFPELAKIMAITKTNKKKLASVIHKAPSAVTDKTLGRTEWKQSEMAAAVLYFKELSKTTMPELLQLYPEITSDFIFSRSVHHSEQKCS